MNKSIVVDNLDKLINLCGTADENLKRLNEQLNVNISTLNGELIVRGEESDVDLAVKVIETLLNKAHEQIKRPLIDLVIDMVKEGNEEDLTEVTAVVTVNSKGRPIRSKTYGQFLYTKAIERTDVVFGIGPAGTGKTYLAVAMAFNAFKNKRIDKIILTRPAVEAGEKLGFLPGDLEAKVDPYLKPLSDALQEMFGTETYAKLVEKGNIEIAPLAYMRGRTLSDAFIILDEAQNTTQEQMKMFLTRLGEGSKMVITGDVTQIDLPIKSCSGLIHASKVLTNVEGIKIVRLSGKDIVRNNLVQKIVEAYEKFNDKE